VNRIKIKNRTYANDGEINNMAVGLFGVTGICSKNMFPLFP
jgi:hypothetical protein